MKSILVISVLALVGSAHATQWILSTTMDPQQENPPVASQASGSFLATYNDVTNALVVTSMSVSNFTGSLTVSHIHRAAVGTNGPVSMDFGPSTNWTNNGGGNYTYNGGSFTFNESFEAVLLNGGSYVNVHSSFAPGGEVRGQILATAVPEPASMTAVALSLAALARRRRQN